MNDRLYVLLDRDGTVIEDRDYLSDPEGVALCPNAGEGLRAMMAMELGLAVVSNQSGIARGYFGEAELRAVNDRMLEVLAERGKKTLAFGPMKPVGLTDPRDGKRPYAVVQLRKENASGTMLNLVGFQTKMKYPEQDRVFRMIPALKDAVFLRYGSIHRNTYINAPLCLNEKLELKADRRILFAGQITGVEGYMESTAMGLAAGISAFMSATGREFHPPPPSTCIGALIRYLTTENRNFQPMNMNFGLIEGYSKKNKEAAVETALQEMEKWKNSYSHKNSFKF